MRNFILAAILAGATAGALAAPAEAGRGSGGSFHRGSHVGFRGGFAGGHVGGWHGGGWNNNGWYAIIQAPGGWNSYYRPVRGWTLPGYWNRSEFFIDDWQRYRLRRPHGGYRWSRYYNDAVLVDSYGRVIDAEYGLDWDPDYGHGYARGPDGDAYAGGTYAYGYAGGDDRPGGYAHPNDGYALGNDDRVTYNKDYDGRWEGTWYGHDGRVYSGTYEGSYNAAPADTRPAPGASYAPPPTSYAPPAYGYGADYSVAYQGPTTVVTVSPMRTTTSTTTTEFIEENVVTRRAAPKKRRAHRSCAC